MHQHPDKSTHPLTSFSIVLHASSIFLNVVHCPSPSILSRTSGLLCIWHSFITYLQLHCPPCYLFCTSRLRCTKLCTAIRPFSVVLLANSDDFRRKPIGWLQRWFGGNEEQKRRPDMVLMVKRAKNEADEPKSLTKNLCWRWPFFNPSLSIEDASFVI